MTVYIEIAILDNIFVTVLICALSYRFLKLRASKKRIALACVVSGVATALFPYLSLEWYFLLLIKVGLGGALSLILFCGKKNVVVGMSVFFLATFVFGGGVFAIGLCKYKNVLEALTKPVFTIPLGVVLGVVFCMYLFIKRLVLMFHRKINDKQLNYKVKIKLNGKECSLVGFLDTGNRLFDNVSGLPIVIISLKEAIKLFSDVDIANILLNKGDKIKGCHYVEVCAINSSSKILVVHPNEFVLYLEDKAHIIEDVMLGISPMGIKKTLGVELILHPAIF